MSELTPSEQEAVVARLTGQYDYASTEWQEIRREGAIDMRCVGGDPWDPKERNLRREAKRPCLSLDELGQYVNQLINEVRQHKRSIKVTPIGAGSNDGIARLRENLIRQIEYRSNAQIAYTTGFENAVQRSYGFWRVLAQYESPRSFHQELVIKPIENPDCFTPDPDGLSPVGQDWKYAFYHEWWNIKDFTRRWPDAKVKGVDKGAERDAPRWWRKDRIQIAEYWAIEPDERELLQLELPDGTLAEVFADELRLPADDENPEKARRWMRRFGQLYALYSNGQAGVINRRAVEYPYVCQYMTNGTELLPPNPERPKQLKNPWRGTTLPFIGCYGKILWIDETAGRKSAGEVVQEDGSGSRRKILSLPRLARDPYMLYCYYRTSEAELVGMTPKFPYFWYEGSLDPEQQQNLAKSLHEPVAGIKVKPNADGWPLSAGPMPFPARQPYEPPIAALEMGAEAARRAIQAAMGIMPLPTQAQRQNEKSGVALERIKTTSQQGSFHFVDHYEMAITRTGAILDELLPHYYDASRDVTVRDAKDEVTTVRINDPQANAGKDYGDGPLMLSDDAHDVTLSTGPSYESEREAATDFADNLVGAIQNIAGIIGAPQAAQLLSLTVKLKNLGPIGDEIAKMLSPMEAGPDDPMVLKQQLMQAQQMVQALQQELRHAQQIIETKQIETAGKVQIETAKAETSAQQQIAKSLADMQMQMRELEVKLEIELAKLGSQQALARGQAEMDDLHHHDELAVRREEVAMTDAQQTLDRQERQSQADADRQFQSEQSEKDRVAKNSPSGVSSGPQA